MGFFNSAHFDQQFLPIINIALFNSHFTLPTFALRNLLCQFCSTISAERTQPKFAKLCPRISDNRTHPNVCELHCPRPFPKIPAAVHKKLPCVGEKYENYVENTMQRTFHLKMCTNQFNHTWRNTYVPNPSNTCYACKFCTLC